MARILFLAHRIPYPPNKGDKIRSWNFLKHLFDKHEVHLGFFIDDKADYAHLAFLEKTCAGIMYAYASPFKQKLASLRGFLTGKSLTECAYPSGKLRRKIKALIDSKEIDLIFVYSAAPFAWLPSQITDIPIITDFVDVDSAKWDAYAFNAKPPLSWVYKREAQYLSHYEASVASKSDASILVSDDEVALFRQNLPDDLLKKCNITGVKNGVDCHAFMPRENKVNAKENDNITRLIFTGAMDYQPNIEAVLWFVKHVFLEIIKSNNAVELIIAGAPVASEVKALAATDGISVLGRVTDMADEIDVADIVIAPLQTARGIQNKVLEGMAMAKPVIATSAANEGINAPDGEALLIADTPEAYLTAIAVLKDNQEKSESLGINARKFVEENFSWPASWKALDTLIDNALSRGAKDKST